MAGYITIRTVAELLGAFQEAEIRQIEKAGIRDVVLFAYVAYHISVSVIAACLRGPSLVIRPDLTEGLEF